MGLANAVDANQQGVQYQSSAGAWSGLDGGTAGSTLQSNGPGVAPSFGIGNANLPAFQAYLSANTGGITGDGTVATIICDTEVYDIGNIYNNSTGIFTAPTTGLYSFDCILYAAPYTASHTFQQFFLTISTGVIYYFLQINPFATVTGATAGAFSGSMTLQMTAGNTAQMQFNVGTGTKTVVAGGSITANQRCVFSGVLIT